MTPARWLRYHLPEYPSVLRRAGQEGWLASLMLAHATACTMTQAEALLGQMPHLPKTLRVRFRAGVRCGRASWRSKERRYGLTLPEEPGTDFGHLRIGLVLHEAAHVWDHQRRQHFDHGPYFCRRLREACQLPWRRLMPTRSYKEIYARHRGPYTLLLTRQVAGKKKPEEQADVVKGPFSAEEAHEEARMLVTDPRENVTAAFVFSDTEGQHIGAVYKRGGVYPPWYELQEAVDAGGVDVSEPSAETTLFSGGEITVPQVDVTEQLSVPADAGSDAGSVRDVPVEEGTAPSPDAPKRTRKPRADKLPGDRFPTVRGSRLTLGREEGWPPSEAAQLVKQLFAPGVELTSAEIVAAIGGQLQAMGVQHPASLVSRLKQAGLLVVKG